MHFYHATRFIFPRSFELRMLAICFVCVHIPLLACVVFQAITLQWDISILLVILLATLTGTAIGTAAIHALLSPVAKATLMLEAVQSGKRVGTIPVGGDDLVGRLLLGVTTAADEAADRLEKLASAAERDALTGIRNRRGFIESAASVLDESINSVVALLDIDHFKMINDQFGHDEGDAILKLFAKRLEIGIRRSDVAARWGGEEFIVLFPDTTLEEARRVLERLRSQIALDSAIGKQDWPLTFSCGIAALRDPGELEEATRRADSALYGAKQNGRNRVQQAH